MKKLIFLYVFLITTTLTVKSQKGVDFNLVYAAGGKMLMNVDSSAKNVYYANRFPNQPNTSFNFLPEVNNVNIQVNFRKTEDVQNYRYTIWEDHKALTVNKSIDLSKLKDTHAGGDEELFRSTSFGVFPIKNRIITILAYNINKPFDVQTTIFYGKPIPKPKIMGFARRFKTAEGVDYNWITNLKDTTEFTLTEKDDEITIVKDRSDIDYLYMITIKDLKNEKVVYESRTWEHGTLGEDHRPLPSLYIDKNIFKKSGDYEIVIQPSINWANCYDCNMPLKQIEGYTTRHLLSVTLEEESYTKKELFLYIFTVTFAIGVLFFIILYMNKKQNRKKMAVEEQQKKTAKLQLSSIRSQLNPHFMFNALAGIQSLMNQSKVEEANLYLNRFSRLTRNVLDQKDLISLAEERDLLNDYLRMEQYRFGFQYQIHVDEAVDLNIEIPAMLLQPFVENAVKHGISSKASSGEIAVVFSKENQSLIVTVKDNGNGFEINKSYDGLGLQLSKNRIELLNNIYLNTKFQLRMHSTGKGTEIKIIIVDWL